MAVRELAIKVIQQFTGAGTAVVPPLLPQLIIGPGYNVQSKQAHANPYAGVALTVPYPNLGSNEYVDQGDDDSWEVNENRFPVSVHLSDAKKVTASSPTGHFGSAIKKSGQQNTGGLSVTGCSPVFAPGDVGKKVYIHDGPDTGPRTIQTVTNGGADITVDGVNFTATQSVQMSLLPTTEKVQRLYDAGKFSNARVGDMLQVGPTWTEEYEITAVDASYNWIELANTRDPSAEPTSWRIVADVTEIELVSGTDFTFDRDNVYLADGISDPASPSGAIIDSTIKVSYRALKSNLAIGMDYVESDADITSKVGIISEANPLALALKKARENTTTRIYFAGMDVNGNVKSGATEFDSMAKLSMDDVLNIVADEDVYVIDILTQSPTMNSKLDTHVTDVSDPNGTYNRERIGIINTALIDETALQLEQTESSWDVKGVTEVVSAPSDARIFAKTSRLWSRGIGEYPDFNSQSSPKPVNPLTDLVRLWTTHGLEPTNDGYWGLEQAEQLLVRNPAAPNSAPNWGYFVANDNRVRSGAFGLTASENAGYVRLTGPAGCFKYIPTSVVFPLTSCRAYLPGAQSGVVCNVTGWDAAAYSYVDTNIPWDTGYTTAGKSQISVPPYDDVFATPGLTASKVTRNWANINVVNATGVVTDAAAGGIFTADDVGMYIWVAGTANDWYLITGYTDANNVTIASPPADQTGVAGKIENIKITGVTSEFAGVTAQVSGCTLKYAGRANSLAGTTKNTTKNIDSFPAGTWGPTDVGRKIRATYFAAAPGGVPGGWTEEYTITDIVDDTEITTDRSANYTAAQAVSVVLSDQSYLDLTQNAGAASLKVISYTANDVTLNISYAQKYLGSNLCSLTIPGVGTFGFGDQSRDVRILGGSYANTSATVQAVRPEELALVGTPFSGGDDVSGFAIAFVSTPGKNVFKMKLKDGAYPKDDAGEKYSVERDFRYFDLNNETLLSKVQTGDVIRVSSPSDIAGDYEIDSVVSDTRVLLAQGSGFSLNSLPSVFSGGTLSNLVYELVRPKTKDQQAETIRDYAAAIANRRIVLTWPDQNRMDVDGETKEVPGYYFGAAIGAMISGLPPQQPLSRLGITGFGRLIHSKVDNYFTRTHLNTIASGGVLIVHMENDTDTPHIRHQLTTDVTDIKRQELSVTKIVDYITRIIKQEFEPYLGKYNINEALIAQLRNVGQSIVTYCENFNDINAGPLVNEMVFERIEQSEVNLDEVEADVYVDAPIPFNVMTVTVIV